jgi:predicted RNase H-like HicB family nuclease
MQRTASYLVLISRQRNSYVATCPAFPELAATGSGTRQAYARLKIAIKAQLLKLISGGEAIPPDPVVQSHVLRLDLWYLRDQEELR